MKVSAVVPVYNSVNTLERAINSLLIQPEINQIFIVDDGSNDGSYPLELELESKNPIIKVLSHPDRINKGASASRNLGLFHCSNEWVQFLDADDELLSNKIFNQLVYADSNVGCIVSPYFYIKEGKSYLHDFFLNDVWVSLLLTRLGRTSSMIFNTRILKIVKWRENLANVQEYYLLLDLISNGFLISTCDNCSTNIYFYKFSISSTLNEEKRINMILFRSDVKKYLQKSNNYTLKYFYYFNVSAGKVYKNFKPSISVSYVHLIYILHRLINKYLLKLE